MARNLNMKVNNLKISTNVENLYENKISLSSNKKTPNANSLHSYHNRNTSPKMIYNSIINTNTNNYTKPNIKNNVETDNKIRPTMGYRSNSKSGSILHGNVKDERHIKLKADLDLDTKFVTESFSPKTTKINLMSNKLGLNLNVNNNYNVNNNGIFNSFNSNINTKLSPYSTRNNSITPSTLVNLAKKENETDSNGVEVINVMSLLGTQNSVPITLKNLNANIPNYETSKYSLKSMSVIKAYAANTHQGIIRTYNEDRVSIILNIIKPSTFTGDIWPKCSFFGIYDGHGGSSCADFLRDQLHQFIIKDPNFPTDIKEAIKRGFEAAEKEFINTQALNKNGDVIDRSGSCAIVTLIVDNMCYVANVGDSRAILSLDTGKDFNVLTNDHKPNEPQEKKRIVENGGKVYQTQTPAKNFNLTMNNLNNNQVIVGPYRVFPGRLSVSRTFGDIEAKLIKFGGLPNVIVPTPEITSFEIKSNMDFIIMGCDGIFDQLTNIEVISSAWMTCKENLKGKNIHAYCGTAVDMIIKTSLVRRTLDNVTCVIIAFSNYEKLFQVDENSNSSSNSNDIINQNNGLHNNNNSNIPIHNFPNLQHIQSSSNVQNIQKNNFTSNINSSHMFEKYNSNSNKNSSRKLDDKKVAKGYESYDEIKNNNYEAYKYSLTENPYTNNFNQTRKPFAQKKLVSLDLTSSNKKNLNNNLFKSESKEHSGSGIRKLDYSEHFEREKKNIQSINDYHPSTTKHSKSRENGLINSIKKITSIK